MAKSKLDCRLEMEKLLDIIILIVIGFAGLKCYFMGFTRSIWGWVAIASGIFIASRTWSHLADLLDGLIKNDQVTKVVTVLIIVFGTAILVDHLFRKLNVIVQKGVIGWINSALGIAFGVALASLLIGGALILLEEYAGDSFQKIIVQSKFAPYLMRFTRYVIGVSKVIIDKSEGVPV